MVMQWQNLPLTPPPTPTLLFESHPILCNFKMYSQQLMAGK